MLAYIKLKGCRIESATSKTKSQKEGQCTTC
jgi:hypothetical protein